VAVLVARVFESLHGDALASRDRAEMLRKRASTEYQTRPNQAEALRAVARFIRAGESCYLVGPPGTGKSWLLEHAALRCAKDCVPTRYLTEATLTEAHRARFAKGYDAEASRLRGWGEAIWADAMRVQRLVLDEFALRSETTDAYLAALEGVIEHRWTCQLPTAFGSNHHIVAPTGGDHSATVSALRGGRIASRINGMVGGLTGGRLVYLDGQDLRGVL
jgi:DNA replication protein DnaC